jgi:peptidyl-prolyl cis-trans isomerase C
MRLNVENETRLSVGHRDPGRQSSAAVTDEALQAAYDARLPRTPPRKRNMTPPISSWKTEEKAKDQGPAGRRRRFRRTRQGQFHRHRLGRAGRFDLGWFGLGMMVKPFEDAVVAAVEGKVSGPGEKSDFGWHLILVNETRDRRQPTLDDVREELAAEIEQKASRQDRRTDRRRQGREAGRQDRPALLKNHRADRLIQQETGVRAMAKTDWQRPKPRS